MMAPVVGRELRSRRRNGSEKTTTTWKRRGGQGVKKKMIATKKRRGGGLRTEKTKRRGGGQGTEKKTTIGEKMKGVSNVHQGDDSGDDVESDDSDDSDDCIETDRETVIAEAKALLEDECVIESEAAFKDLNTFLTRQGLTTDCPYKDAIHKFLTRGIDKKIRVKIAWYIFEKLRLVKRYLVHLLAVTDWDTEVTGLVAEIIKKEMIEHLEVEVTELKDIFLLAEEVRTESQRRQLVKGEAMKNRVRSWSINTREMDTTVRKWAKNPTSMTFSSCDVPYNDIYEQPPFIHLSPQR